MYRQIKREEDRREYHREYWHKRKLKDSTETQQAQPNQPIAYTDTKAEAEKKKTRAPKAPAATPTGFAEFWDTWPNTARKANKKGCLNIWTRNKLEGKAGEIIKHVEAMKQSKPWKEGFEPAPMTYLNQERWSDGVKVDAEQDELRALFARAE
jgi:hypothetical protein